MNKLLRCCKIRTTGGGGEALGVPEIEGEPDWVCEGVGKGDIVVLVEGRFAGNVPQMTSMNRFLSCESPRCA
jgi:hypothetical protein